MCAQSLVRQDVSERPRSFCFWGREGQRQMNRGRQCSEMQPNDNNRAGSVHGCTQTACLHAGFPYCDVTVHVTFVHENSSFNWVSRSRENTESLPKPREKVDRERSLSRDAALGFGRATQDRRGATV